MPFKPIVPIYIITEEMCLALNGQSNGLCVSYTLEIEQLQILQNHDHLCLRFIFWVFKGSRTGHSVKDSLWYASLLTNTRFRFLYFRISNC